MATGVLLTPEPSTVSPFVSSPSPPLCPSSVFYSALSLVGSSSFTQQEFGRAVCVCACVHVCVCVQPGAGMCTAEVFDKDNTRDSVLVSPPGNGAKICVCLYDDAAYAQL